MLHSLINTLDTFIGLPKVSAHCDIPCGVYDPITAQLAALSTLRFVDLIAELEAKDSLTLADQAKLVRLVNEKELHAEKVKAEVRVIWGDFFKAAQFEKFPDTHELVHNIMLAGSASKQHIGREYAENLLNLTNEFAQRFWQCKDVETYKAVAPYAPNEVLVYPKLDAQN